MSTFRKSLIILQSAALLIGINACSSSGKIKQNKAPKMDAVVSTQWLSDHLNDPNLVILDTTVLVTMGGKGGFSMA